MCPRRRTLGATRPPDAISIDDSPYFSLVFVIILSSASRTTEAFSLLFFRLFTPGRTRLFPKKPLSSKRAFSRFARFLQAFQRHDEERHSRSRRALVRRLADRFRQRAPAWRRRDFLAATRNFPDVWRLRRFAARVLARLSSRFGPSDAARVARFERRFFGTRASTRAPQCVRKPLVPACSHLPPRR